MKIKLDWYGIAPYRAHDTDAGMDIYLPGDTPLYIEPKGSVKVRTGVHVQLPHGTVGMIKSRSGMNINYGVQSEGVVDEGYTGEIVVKLYNHSDEFVKLEPKSRICQLVVLPVSYESIDIVENLDESERGDNGFGSTGR